MWGGRDVVEKVGGGVVVVEKLEDNDVLEGVVEGVVEDVVEDDVVEEEKRLKNERDSESKAVEGVVEAVDDPKAVVVVVDEWEGI